MGHGEAGSTATSMIVMTRRTMRARATMTTRTTTTRTTTTKTTTVKISKTSCVKRERVMNLSTGYGHLSPDQASRRVSKGKRPLLPPPPPRVRLEMPVHQRMRIHQRLRIHQLIRIHQRIHVKQMRVHQQMHIHQRIRIHEEIRVRLEIRVLCVSARFKAAIPWKRRRNNFSPAPDASR